MKTFFIGIAIFLFLISVVHSGDRPKFNDLPQIKTNFINELSSGQDSALDQNEIIAIETDLNGDGAMDYWLVYPPMQCSDSECFGLIYLNYNKCYCFAGNGYKETDLYSGVSMSLICK